LDLAYSAYQPRHISLFTTLSFVLYLPLHHYHKGRYAVVGIMFKGTKVEMRRGRCVMVEMEGEGAK